MVREATDIEYAVDRARLRAHQVGAIGSMIVPPVVLGKAELEWFRAEWRRLQEGAGKTVLVNFIDDDALERYSLQGPMGITPIEWPDREE